MQSMLIYSLDDTEIMFMRASIFKLRYVLTFHCQD